MGIVVVAVLSLLLAAYCVLDVATSRPADVRGLPKPLWFPVLLLPLIGPAAWWLAGRPAPGSARSTPRVLPPAEPSRSPDDDEDFLRQLRRRAEEQRRQAEEQQRRDGGAPGGDRPV